MMKTLRGKDLDAWEKAAKNEKERGFRKTVKEMASKGLLIVRKDDQSERLELIPSGSMREKMGNAGLNATTLRSFRL